MKKDDISEKVSQEAEEIEDKSLPYYKNKGRRIGIVILLSTYLLIMAFTLFFRDFTTGCAINSIAFAVSATDELSLYYLTKKDKYLGAAILSTITSILSVIAYIFSIAL